jgi:hypothetical protein
MMYKQAWSIKNYRYIWDVSTAHGGAAWGGGGDGVRGFGTGSGLGVLSLPLAGREGPGWTKVDARAIRPDTNLTQIWYKYVSVLELVWIDRIAGTRHTDLPIWSNYFKRGRTRWVVPAGHAKSVMLYDSWSSLEKGFSSLLYGLCINCSQAHEKKPIPGYYNLPSLSPLAGASIHRLLAARHEGPRTPRAGMSSWAAAHEVYCFFSSNFNKIRNINNFWVWTKIRNMNNLKLK